MKHDGDWNLWFPSDSCPNCGATTGLEATVQTTRKVTGYFLFAGTELTLSFPLNACRRCMPTLKRSPLSTGNKALIALLFAAATYLLFMPFLLAQRLTHPLIEANPGLASLVLGLLLPWGWFRLRSPSPPQTSYYQPIRILTLKRAFRTGEIESMTLGFTHEQFLKSFLALNQEAVRAGTLRGVRA